MKKIRLALVIFCLLTLVSTSTFAQRFSFGEYTGINFSNLHGNLLSNKWLPKTGPNTGLFAEYSFAKSFSFQAEINYLALYYEMKSYQTQPPGPIYYDDVMPLDYSSFVYYPYYQDKYDYSFLRFPLFIKYKTPTKLQLALGGGLFYSILLKDDLTNTERDAAKEEDRRIYPPKHDWGYIFSADLSYPVTKEISFFVTGRLTSGQKVFVENVKGENGSTELGFGLKYTPRNKKGYEYDIAKTSQPDSSEANFFIKPVAGLLVGWNSGPSKGGNYSAKTGTSSGFYMEYKLNKTFSLQSGVLFERKGYAISDSSLYYHRITKDKRFKKKMVDTKTELDYITLPVEMKLSFGNPFTFYANAGFYTGFKVNALCHGTAIEKSLSSYGYSLQKIHVNDAVEGFYHDVDFGYRTGFGFQFPIRKNMKFDLGFVYSNSFSSIINRTDENSSGYYSDDTSIKNGSIALQFGLQIPITR